MNIKNFLVGAATGALMLGVMITPAFAVSTSTASCPEGTKKSISPIETLSVPSNLSVATPSLATLLTGKYYLLVASGTWANRNDANQQADAEYATMDSWASWMDGYDLGDYKLGLGEFDLQINGLFVDWGAYNSQHTYTRTFAGTGNKVDFLIFDGDSNIPTLHPEWYGDNSGSLTVNIYSCDSVKIGPPTDKDQCKKDGWKLFNNPSFRNQGQCVSFVEKNKERDEKDKKDKHENEDQHDNRNNKEDREDRGSHGQED
jgi:hypothetical protein